jgi:DNA (cytosine-5)-methyltransferase 1
MSDIATIRRSLGLSDQELATLLGLSDQQNGSIEKWASNGNGIPNQLRRRLENLPEKIPYLTKCRADSPRFRFIDLFAGVGGIRLPFQARGGECVFTAEWDKHAQITYAANFGHFPPKNGDITAFSSDEIPTHDILLAGFPCQTFSQAGRKAGFLDTRGTMFFEIQRILAHHRPSAFLLENVKQLRGHDKGRTLKTIMAILRGEEATRVPVEVPMSAEAREGLEATLNYNADFRVFKAREFGVPQTRERIYIVGFNRDKISAAEGKNLVSEMFDRIYAAREEGYSHRRFGDVLEKDLKKTMPFSISLRLWNGHMKRKQRHLENGNGFGYSLFDHNSEYCNTISARYYKDGSEILVHQPDLPTPRKLTPREAARIQGFPEEFHINSVSHTQAYRQFGNSVAVPVIDAIAREMLPILGVPTTEHSGLWPI